MSSSGIGKIGVNAPPTSREKISGKNNSKNAAEIRNSSDSLKISDDGLKIEGMFQNLRYVKSKIEEKPEIAFQIHKFPNEKIAEFFEETNKEVQANLYETLRLIKEKSKIALKVHSLNTDSVAAFFEGD